MDACVLPLTHSIMPLITPGLRKITNLQQVVTLEDEVTAWKQLLPAFAERCRTWKHTESPLCGCGQGKNLGPFSQTSAWKDFAPFVTRIALAPLFSTSFVNNPLSSKLETSNSDTIGEDRCKHCGNRNFWRVVPVRWLSTALPHVKKRTGKSTRLLALLPSSYLII
ncbi:uncharacterized protein LACBIDRAFT_311356 [Laccaria bicolor S238N-H82]|uniref:Predicted protein n=1 Tax=Laccaria bicolor (strain S238N-H82 / ATCC MYA-4686) TaxID=486041 RepID=B0CZU0_LACBS|nr:uncharacterized protein LACBIDRAFT_311356 [Laccaria bicolor S238N-H82]EDR12675.1 predicted protein [Laccaria bicolor S238N-H82]|eukprot:XP_001876939.1 predicted protein [Laccaria bicolor S238N-H82]